MAREVDELDDTPAREQLPRSSRYELLVRIASGGMATVYLGRLRGAVGFWRLVAIKRAHAHLAEDAAFSRMFMAEARLASRIHHPNVVPVQDVEQLQNELLLVMDYIEGAALSDLLASASRPSLSPGIAIRIILDACAGLHAAHQLTDDAGTPLELVHRDVSPHNILLGTDGIARIADFGVAKSLQGDTAPRTATGGLKGKIGYMAPEYIEGRGLDVRSDVFALGVVAWEAVARQRLFRAGNELETMKKVVSARIPKLSAVAPELGTALDSVIAKALERVPGRRYASAQEFGAALEGAARAEDLIASHQEVAAAVQAAAGEIIAERRELLRRRIAEVGRSRAAAPVDAAADASRSGAADEEVASAVLPAPTPELQPEADSTLGGSGRSHRNLQRMKRGGRSWLARGALTVALTVTAAAAAIAMNDRIPSAPAPHAAPSAETERAEAPRQPEPVPTPQAAFDEEAAASARAEPPSASAQPSASPARNTARAPPRRQRTSAPVPAPPVPDKAAPNPYVVP
jgi:serine/threonine-protein kinase